MYSRHVTKREKLKDFIINIFNNVIGFFIQIKNVIINIYYKIYIAIARRKWSKKVVTISTKMWVLMNTKRYQAFAKITLLKLNKIVYYAANKAPVPVNELKITFNEIEKAYKKLQKDTRTENTRLKKDKREKR